MSEWVRELSECVWVNVCASAPNLWYLGALTCVCVELCVPLSFVLCVCANGWMRLNVTQWHSDGASDDVVDDDDDDVLSFGCMYVRTCAFFAYFPVCVCVSECLWFIFSLSLPLYVLWAIGALIMGRWCWFDSTGAGGGGGGASDDGVCLDLVSKAEWPSWP